MATHVPAVRERRAKDVMTRVVLTVQPDWPVEQLADFLVRNNIHGAPVTSNAGELLGVVSLTDIARATTLSDSDLSPSDRHDFYRRLLDEPYQASPIEFVEEHAQLKVQEIMTPVVLDVDETTPVPLVARRMIESQVHRLFVTRMGRIVGIISALDLLKVLRDI